MKKITSILLSVCVILSMVFIQADAQTYVKDGTLEFLSYLNIMSGDPDGNMRLDDAVSRAEFSKMAVMSSAYKNTVPIGLSVSPFPDVTYKHWAAPYVRVAVTNGIVSGYPNGTFEPEITVSYEEAVTMMLRVLSYQDSDFGNTWPYGQLGIADSIDLTKDIDCATGDTMTRRDCVKLIYNALKCDMKNGANTLAKAVFGIEITEDQTVIATYNEDKSIPSDSIRTSLGTSKLDVAFDSKYIGLKGDVAIKDNKKFVGFISESGGINSEEYIVYSAFDDKVLAYKNGSITQVNISDGTTVYKGSTTTSYGMIKNTLKLGDVIRVRKLEAGDVDYITYIEGNLQGPVTANGNNWQTMWNVSSDAKITRNGASVTVGGIKAYDILYYIPDINMVMAYSDKKTGVYEAAEPNPDALTSIVVSGKSYKIESSSAFNKVHSGGEFTYGDTITLLLGKDGAVADVISPTASASDIAAGYVIGTGQKEYQNGNDTFKNYYIRLVGVDGVEYEYITDRDYTDYKNSVVSVSFSNGNARITNVNGSVSGGTFDWGKKKLGSNTVSSDVKLLDIGTRDSASDSMYAKVYGQRIDGITISSKDILYSVKNSNGDITGLILNNVTGDAYQYALVTSINSSSMGRTYSYLYNGTRYTFTSSSNLDITRGAASKIFGSAVKPYSMIDINHMNGSVSSFTSDSITIGGESHKISGNVQCYLANSSVSSEYEMTTVDYLIQNKNNYSFNAYYDKADNIGGRVRVIVAVKK